MNNNYYIGLEVVDRISTEAIRKYNTLSKFSASAGRSNCWWYRVVSLGGSITVRTLIDVARVLDLSVEYLLTGKNRKPFEEVSLEHLGRVKLRKRDNSLRVVKSQLHNDKQNSIHLTTLLNFADATGIPASRFLKGEF